MWNTEYGDWLGEGRGFFTSKNAKFHANDNGSGGLQLSARSGQSEEDSEETGLRSECGCDSRTVSLGVVSSKVRYGYGTYTLTDATFGMATSSAVDDPAGIQYGFWLQNENSEIDGFNFKTRSSTDCTDVNHGAVLDPSVYGHDIVNDGGVSPKPATCWGDNAFNLLSYCSNSSYPEFQAACCFCGNNQLSTAARCFGPTAADGTDDYEAIVLDEEANQLSEFVSDTVPHTYTIVWLEDAITFKVDGIAIRTIDTASAGLDCLGGSSANNENKTSRFVSA